MTTIFCEDAPFLKLGPGPSLPESQVLTFVNGFAEIDPDDPNYDEKMRWVEVSKDAYRIEVLDDSDRGRVARGINTARFACNICGKEYDSQRSLTGHRMSHAPKKARA